VKIAMVRDYTAPAKDSQGAGRIMESLAKRFLHLGHEVVMKLSPDSTSAPAPLVDEVPTDCDIIHYNQWSTTFDHDKFHTPWIVTIHGGGMETDPDFFKVTDANPHVVCVSEFVRKRLNCYKYIWNCSDPEDFIFEDKKEDYFLWMAGTDWGESKGLFTTIRLAKKLRFKLLIAGSGKNQNIIDTIKSLCDDKIKYIGSINGIIKAEVLSKARALILLTQVGDACPTVVSECMLSGTPIIASTNGAMPELITDKVGFVCKNDQDFTRAVLKIGKIDPHECRKWGMTEMSSGITAGRYLQCYNNMINFGKVI
jgi:glycosyltransferase involved in cell wall biosynthesis